MNESDRPAGTLNCLSPTDKAIAIAISRLHVALGAPSVSSLAEVIDRATERMEEVAALDEAYARPSIEPPPDLDTPPAPDEARLIRLELSSIAGALNELVGVARRQLARSTPADAYHGRTVADVGWINLLRLWGAIRPGDSITLRKGVDTGSCFVETPRLGAEYDDSRIRVAWGLNGGDK
jgi:hypothetical protein